MLYDSNMEPISDAFGFLNYDKSSQSINSRIKTNCNNKLNQFVFMA